MQVYVGEVEAQVLENTEHLGAQAKDQLAEQIKDLAGRRFFGESRVSLVWVAGQIVELKPSIEQRIR
jgi:hypothetical protein